MNYQYDIAIIGGGAVGLSCALQLKTTLPSLSVCVIEKEADTAFGTSGRNSAVVHSGFNNPADSLKAKLCVEGSRDFESLASELGIEYRKTGKLVVGFSEEDKEHLEKLLAQGKVNGVDGLEIIDKNQILQLNHHIEGDFALYSHNTAVFNPFEYCTALTKRIYELNTELFFSTEVTSIKKTNDNKLWALTAEKTFISDKTTFKTDQIHIFAKVVVNSAGLNSGKIAKLAGAGEFEIKPCRGEYHILEKEAASLINMPVYPVPNEEKNVLGIHITPTTDGKVMFGPSAEFIDDSSDYSTSEKIMKTLKEGGTQLCPKLKDISVIRSFSGIRPKCEANDGDFTIEESLPGFINLVGIESPGMTASMPIGRLVSNMVISSSCIEGRIPFEANTQTNQDIFTGESGCISQQQVISAESESVKINSENKSTAHYNNHRLICRCEGVTAGDILKAFDDICKIGAIPTIKGLKNRTGAFMGLCQGGFCTVDTADLLEIERNFNPNLLTYDGPGSEMFDKNTRLK